MLKLFLTPPLCGHPNTSRSGTKKEIRRNNRFMSKELKCKSCSEKDLLITQYFKKRYSYIKGIISDPQLELKPFDAAIEELIAFKKPSLIKEKKVGLESLILENKRYKSARIERRIFIRKIKIAFWFVVLVILSICVYKSFKISK